MSLPYFPLYPTDFEADTSHLTLEEDGAYNRLMRLMWMTPGCSLPDDDVWIARRMRVDAETFERVVRGIVDEFFVRGNGRCSNARLALEYEKTTEAHERRVSAGSSGGKAKSLKTNKTKSSNAVAMPKQPEPEPEPSREKKERKKEPQGAAGQAGTDFQKGKSAKGWLWSDGVDHIVRTTDKSQQQAKSTAGHLLKMCDEKPDRLVKYFITALEQGSDDIVGFIKSQIGKRVSAPAGSDHVEVVAVRCTDGRYKTLQDRHETEIGKRKFQANGVSHFPKSWVDELMTSAAA